MSKTITQAHKDAIAAARPETHFESHVEKVVQAYLKSMLDDGFVIVEKDADIRLEDLG